MNSNNVVVFPKENKNIKKIIEESKATKLNLFQFYFNIHIPDTRCCTARIVSTKQFGGAIV